MWVVLGGVGDSWAQPSPAPGWAVVEQERLPELLARQATAEAQLRARSRFAAGTASLEEAFPSVPASALGDERLLRGRLAQLAESEVERSIEAQSPPLAVQESEAREAAWREALEACHAAEAAAARAERGFVIGVVAQLRAAPHLSRASVSAWRADLVALRDHVDELPEALDPVEVVMAEARAAEAAVALEQLDAWVQTLRLLSVRAHELDLSTDLAALGGPTADLAADRLALAAPLLRGVRAVEVAEALEDHWGRAAQADASVAEALREAQEALGEPTDPLPTLIAAEDLARARLAAAEVRVQHAEGAPYEAAARRRLERRRAEVQLAEARRKVKAGVAGAETAEVTARLAEERAQAAVAAAVGDQQATRVAELKQQYAAATERSAALQRALRDVESRRDPEASATIRRQSEAVQRLGQRVGFGESRPDADALHGEVLASLDQARARAAEAFALSLEAREREVETRRAVAADQRRIEEAVAWSVTLLEAPRRDVVEIVAAWQELLQSETEAANAWVAATQEHEQARLADVQRARVAKRELAPYLSGAERAVDANRFFEDLQKEADFLVPSVSGRVQRRWLQLQHPRKVLVNLQWLRAALAGFVWTLLAGVAWWWGRRRADGWALRVAQRVRHAHPELRMADVRALRDPTARAIRNVIDLLLGQVLLYTLGGALLEVQFLVRAYLYLAAYRAMLALFDLAVVPHGEVRPALLMLRSETFALARRTVRWFLGYFVVARLLHWVLWDVLQLDTLAGAVDTSLSALFWVLVVWTLYRWEPAFRETLSRRHGTAHPLVRWLLPQRAGFLLRVPRAVLQLGVLASLFALDLLQWVASEESGLSWLFNALNRAGLRETDKITFRPLDDAVRERIMAGVTPERHLVQRDELAAVGQALAQWRKTGLRGLVALVGDRGMGKHTACHEVADMLHAGGLDVRRARVPGPMRTESDLFAWLASVVGCEGTASTHDELVETLRSVEPRGVIIESVHKTFARRVGGLDVVQALFYVLNAASDHHFFVVSVHGPAWDYFAARGSMVDCGVFHTVVRLAPLTSAQLRKLTLGRAGEVGLRVDFSALERQTALAGEPGTEDDRAVTIFYRLLADASQGSPTAGVEIFTRCLEATDDPSLARAHMGSALTVQPLTDLSDDALFILVAIDLHDDLDIEELGEVTNLPMAAVRATVRDLLSRGLLGREERHLSIPDHMCPPVQRTLRRRHFLHLGGES